MNFRNYLLVGLLSFFTLGCVPPQTDAPPEVFATEADLKIYGERWAEAALKAASQLDDGISDAQTIASAVASQCYKEYMSYRIAWVAVNLKNDNDNVKRMVIQRSKTQEEMTRFHLKVVLTHRNNFKK